MKANKETLDETMSLADEVLSMTSLSDEDRRQTQQDKLSIKREWDTLHDNLEWRNKRWVYYIYLLRPLRIWLEFLVFCFMFLFVYASC